MNDNVRDLVISPSMRGSKLDTKQSFEKGDANKSSGLSHTTKGFMGNGTPIQLEGQMPDGGDLS